MSDHAFYDIGYVTNCDSGERIDMWECSRCWMIYSTDFRPTDECAGEPSELTKAIHGLTTGIAPWIEAALAGDSL